MRTAEVAPGRFSWRKYKNQVNIEQVRRRLTDAALADKGGYVTGSQKLGWQLTEAGMAFAQRAVVNMDKSLLAREPMSKVERNWANRERLRLLTSDAYLAYVSEGKSAITIRQAEAFFRLDDYIEGTGRDQRIDRILNVFGGDHELGEAAQFMAEMLRKGPR